MSKTFKSPFTANDLCRELIPLCEELAEALPSAGVACGAACRDNSRAEVMGSLGPDVAVTLLAIQQLRQALGAVPKGPDKDTARRCAAIFMRAVEQVWNQMAPTEALAKLMGPGSKLASNRIPSLPQSGNLAEEKLAEDLLAAAEEIASANPEFGVVYTIYHAKELLSEEGIGWDAFFQGPPVEMACVVLEFVVALRDETREGPLRETVRDLLKQSFLKAAKRAWAGKNIGDVVKEWTKDFSMGYLKEAMKATVDEFGRLLEEGRGLGSLSTADGAEDGLTLEQTMDEARALLQYAAEEYPEAELLFACRYPSEGGMFTMASGRSSVLHDEMLGLAALLKKNAEEERDPEGLDCVMDLPEAIEDVLLNGLPWETEIGMDHPEEVMRRAKEKEERQPPRISVDHRQRS